MSGRKEGPRLWAAEVALESDAFAIEGPARARRVAIPATLAFRQNMRGVSDGWTVVVARQTTPRWRAFHQRFRLLASRTIRSLSMRHRDCRRSAVPRTEAGA